MGPVKGMNAVFFLTANGVKEISDTLNGPWVIEGTAWDNADNRPVQLIAITDASGFVRAFGFPGFNGPRATPEGTGWKAIFATRANTTAQAFGILGSGQVCPLSGKFYFPATLQKLASDHAISGIPILPGKDVVQRFKPTHRLQEISLNLVTWGARPSQYNVNWRVVALINGQDIELGAGEVDASTTRDWQRLELPISTFPREVPEQIEVSFRAAEGASPGFPLGVAAYQPRVEGNDPLAEVDGTPVFPAALVGLTLSYPRQD
jgi:hypothetical protein